MGKPKYTGRGLHQTRREPPLAPHRWGLAASAGVKVSGVTISWLAPGACCCARGSGFNGKPVGEGPQRVSTRAGLSRFRRCPRNGQRGARDNAATGPLRAWEGVMRFGVPQGSPALASPDTGLMHGWLTSRRAVSGVKHVARQGPSACVRRHDLLSQLQPGVHLGRTGCAAGVFRDACLLLVRFPRPFFVFVFVFVFCLGRMAFSVRAALGTFPCDARPSAHGPGCCRQRSCKPWKRCTCAARGPGAQRGHAPGHHRQPPAHDAGTPGR